MKPTVNGNSNNNSTNKMQVLLSSKNGIILNQNDPNPFAEKTSITYFIPEETTNAQIYFYNLSGSILKTVELKEKGAGELEIFASDLSSGIYTYSIVVDGKTIDSKKMVKLK